MLDHLQEIAEAARITPPARPLPIAVIGAGAITDGAHLPAYASLGLPIVGIFDLDASRAADVASRHGIPRTYGHVSEVFTDPTVEVVDIAVVPWAQPDLVRQGIASGKHMLCQKPFTLDLTQGRELRDEANAAGVRIAVQQQMRFEEGVAAARAMVRAGWIGELVSMTISVNILTDWSGWPWLMESDHLDLMYHSIHYLDSIRSIMGDPTTVFGAVGSTPGQRAKAETRSVSTLVFDNGSQALVSVNHENRAGDFSATFRMDGSGGSIRGTLGLLYDYPNGRPDTLEVLSHILPTDGWLTYPVTTRWLPDAFGGPMASLQEWITEGTPAPTRLDDNLRTLELVEALYASARTGTAQSLTLS